MRRSWGTSGRSVISCPCARAATVGCSGCSRSGSVRWRTFGAARTPGPVAQPRPRSRHPAPLGPGPHQSVAHQRRLGSRGCRGGPGAGVRWPGRAATRRGTSRSRPARGLARRRGHRGRPSAASSAAGRSWPGPSARWVIGVARGFTSIRKAAPVAASMTKSTPHRPAGRAAARAAARPRPSRRCRSRCTTVAGPVACCVRSACTLVPASTSPCQQATARLAGWPSTWSCSVTGGRVVAQRAAQRREVAVEQRTRQRVAQGRAADSRAKASWASSRLCVIATPQAAPAAVDLDHRRQRVARQPGVQRLRRGRGGGVRHADAEFGRPAPAAGRARWPARTRRGCPAIARSAHCRARSAGSAAAAACMQLLQLHGGGIVAGDDQVRHRSRAGPRAARAAAAARRVHAPASRPACVSPDDRAGTAPRRGSRAR